MSTRSRIGKLLPDGSVKSIYCHFDGYPTGVGMILARNYDGDKVDKLLDLGDISSLGEIPEDANDHPELGGRQVAIKKYCMPYNNEDSRAIFNSSEDEYVKKSRAYSDAEYIYLFKDSKWYFADTYKEDGLKELEPVLIRSLNY